MGLAKGLLISDKHWHFSAHPWQPLCSPATPPSRVPNAHKEGQTHLALQRGEPSSWESDLPETTAVEWLKPEILAFLLLHMTSQGTTHNQRRQEPAQGVHSPHAHSNKDNYNLFVHHIPSIFHVQETIWSFSHLSPGRNELPGSHMRAGQPQPALQHWHFPCFFQALCPQLSGWRGFKHFNISSTHV